MAPTLLNWLYMSTRVLVVIVLVASGLAHAGSAPEKVRRAKELLAEVPERVKAANEINFKIETLDRDLPKQLTLGEDAATTERRKQRRELVNKLIDLVMPIDATLGELIRNESGDEGLRALYPQLADAASKLNPYRNAADRYRGELSSEDQQQANAEKRAAPITDRSVRSRLRISDQPVKERFASADRTHFVFPLITIKQDREKHWLPRPISKGEPLLVIGSGGGGLLTATIDGVAATYFEGDLTTAPLKSSAKIALTPEQLEISDKEGVVGGPADLEPDATGFRLEDTRILRALEPGDSRRDKFVEEREKVLSCYTAVMEKLDPDNRRGKYDIMYFRGGVQTKVEPLAAKYDRQACGKCGCKTFNDKKRAFIREVLAPLQKATYVELKPTIDRVEALFR